MEYCSNDYLRKSADTIA